MEVEYKVDTQQKRQLLLRILKIKWFSLIPENHNWYTEIIADAIYAAVAGPCLHQPLQALSGTHKNDGRICYIRIQDPG